MQKEVTNCLLCFSPLQRALCWEMLIERFSPVICTRCEGKFSANDKVDKGHVALFQYNEAMKDFLHRYKFMQDVVLAKVFRRQLHDVLKRQKGIVVPIPLHPERLVERTFSHIDLLLEEAHIPYVHLLSKTTTEQQSKKTRAERLQTAQLFTVSGQIGSKKYILFDDIYTTGTTLAHAKAALLEAGAREVRSVTLIRG